jgi:hypothetical protein
MGESGILIRGKTSGNCQVIKRGQGLLYALHDFRKYYMYFNYLASKLSRLSRAQEENHNKPDVRIVQVVNVAYLNREPSLNSGTYVLVLFGSP